MNVQVVEPRADILVESSMYAWSTVAFALVAALLALFHEKASLVLARKGVMCLAGVISSVGMLMEYAGAFLFFDGANLLFVSRSPQAWRRPARRR